MEVSAGDGSHAEALPFRRSSDVLEVVLTWLIPTIRLNHEIYNGDKRGMDRGKVCTEQRVYITTSPPPAVPVVFLSHQPAQFHGDGPHDADQTARALSF